MALSWRKKKLAMALQSLGPGNGGGAVFRSRLFVPIEIEKKARLAAHQKAAAESALKNFNARGGGGAAGTGSAFQRTSARYHPLGAWRQDTI